MNNYTVSKYLNKVLTKKILFELYHSKNLSTVDLSMKFKCSVSVICKYLKKHNIRMKTRSEAIKGKPSKKDRLRKKFTIKYLHNLYIIEHKTTVDIAKIHKTSHSVVLSYLKKLKIPIRSNSEAHMGINCGEKHPFWTGGKCNSGHSREFKRKRDSIRKRDNDKCQFCGFTQEQNLQAYNEKLSVHHIDYDKSNDKDENLITLCKKCHAKCKGNLDYWYAYSRYLIENFIL